ncbi:hypothetical protein [Candidatus Caldatribacterium sp.]|uniref:hypothetical protein n=1 Tax=Candidatus Caldatribacterium sp. TaxID=2282143 RepID=UPI0029963F78|nr:hypothetical protein [Candidatus Caldatribacterium sp.]MDW8080801.1 hypothetical protein [Candidatus Calescibacterium sp.]
MEQRLREIIQSLIDSCPQEGYIPLEEYTLQESVKAYLLELCDLQPEDMKAFFLSGMSFLETLKKLLGENLVHLSPSTLLWLAEVEKGLALFQEMLKGYQNTFSPSGDGSLVFFGS